MAYPLHLITVSSCCDTLLSAHQHKNGEGEREMPCARRNGEREGERGEVYTHHLTLQVYAPPPLLSFIFLLNSTFLFLFLFLFRSVNSFFTGCTTAQHGGSAQGLLKLLQSILIQCRGINQVCTTREQKRAEESRREQRSTRRAKENNRE